MEIKFNSVCMAKYINKGGNEFEFTDKLREFLVYFNHLLFPPQDGENVSVSDLLSSLMEDYFYSGHIKTILYDEVNDSKKDYKIEIIFKVFNYEVSSEFFEVKLTLRIDYECNYYSFIIELLDKAPISAFLDLRRAAKNLNLEFFPVLK